MLVLQDVYFNHKLEHWLWAGNDFVDYVIISGSTLSERSCMYELVDSKVGLF